MEYTLRQTFYDIGTAIRNKLFDPSLITPIGMADKIYQINTGTNDYINYILTEPISDACPYINYYSPQDYNTEDIPRIVKLLTIENKVYEIRIAKNIVETGLPYKIIINIYADNDAGDLITFYEYKVVDYNFQDFWYNEEKRTINSFLGTRLYSFNIDKYIILIKYLN